MKATCLSINIGRWKNSIINVKLNKRSEHAEIYYINDIEKRVGVDNLDEFIKYTFFKYLTF